MKKKLLSLLLCASLIWGLASHQAYAKSVRDTSFETSLAEDLKSLGLFKGVSETEFDLDRAPSRIEALVMLIRLLGSEKTALEQHMSHPFTDVPDWADDYVGYAYANGLANGITETEFGTGPANAAMYLTFVLRVLGYSDAGGADFSWDSPYALAKRIGVLPDTVDVSNFWRADAVAISSSALQTKLEGGDQTLADKLIEAGIFTESQYEETFFPAISTPQASAYDDLDTPEVEAPPLDTGAANEDATDTNDSDASASDTPSESGPAEKDETASQPDPDKKDDSMNQPQPPEYEKPGWLDEPYDKSENATPPENPNWGEKPDWLDEPYDGPDNNEVGTAPSLPEKPDWLQTR